MNDAFNTNAGNPTEAWSNTKCIELAFKDNFPAAVEDLTVQKAIIERFLNFYLGARIQKGFNVKDIVFSAISIMPLHKDTEEFIFKKIHFMEDGTLFFLTPEDKLSDDAKAKDDADIAADNSPSTSKDSKGNGFYKSYKTENNYQTQVRQIRHEHTSYKLPLEHEETIDDNVTTSDAEEPSDQESIASNESEEAIPKLPSNIRWSGEKRLRPVNTSAQKEYGPIENSAFTTSCNRLLAKWETDRETRIILKYFFGIIALTLMRATTKTYKHLVKTFSGNKFRQTIDFVHSHLRFSVPHKRCVKNCTRTFSRKAGNTSIMFAKIVVNSFHIDALRRQEASKQSLNIFKVTVLAHTADYGFGLVSLLETIVRKVGKEALNDVLKCTYCAETSASWDAIKSFFDKYMVISSKEKTYRWARVIDNVYFKTLSCNSNYVLSVIFGTFIENLTKDSGIWKSTWVETGNATAFKKLGLSMYKKFKELEREKFTLQFISH